jgi:hypothetical protein
MSSDVIALAGLCVTMLGILVGFVWNAAVTATGLKMRVSSLERDHEGTAKDLRDQIRGLQVVIETLRSSVWELTTRLKVNAAEMRASQHDISDTDPPPRNR